MSSRRRTSTASPSRTSSTPCNALAIDESDDDLRLYIGPSRSGSLLEVISLMREGDRGELVIHAMAMRPKYRRLLPGD